MAVLIQLVARGGVLRTAQLLLFFSLPRLEHTTSTRIDPMELRARDTFYRLICLWIISDRWVIGPCLYLLTSVGTTVEELGHDVRKCPFPDNALDSAHDAQIVRAYPDGYGAMNGRA
jgi:hypothetical protein